MIASTTGATGRCAECGVFHVLPRTAEAEGEARALLARVREAGRLDVDARAPLPQLGGAFALDGGCMLGVLIARSAGGDRVVLRAFSGHAGGESHVEGWAPPLHPRRFQAGVRSLAEREVAHLGDVLDALDRELRAHRETHAAAEREAEERRAALRTRHRAERDRRARARRAIDEAVAAGDVDAGEARALTHTLDEESRRDDRERRALRAEVAATLATGRALGEAITRRRDAAWEERRALSRAAMRAHHDAITLVSFAGESRGLADFFPGGAAPTGAGECCAPKLLQEAVRLELVPLAMAEIWIGASPRGRVRHEGAFYAPCAEKCEPLLGFLLCGAGGGTLSRPVAPPGDVDLVHVLQAVHVEDSFVVVDKPPGLLAVPGRGEGASDCVVARVLAAFPHARGPLAVHRLDMDTSGLMVLGLTPEAHRNLSLQFEQRRVAKAYTALVDGRPPGERGCIRLRFRLDPDDRPRQVYDPVAGKLGETEWSVVAAEGDVTRVHFVPRTGRTHQLRVHAAHPLGLACPIVGDRLYGDASSGARLMLHAHRLSLRHPETHAPLSFERAPPF